MTGVPQTSGPTEAAEREAGSAAGPARGGLLELLADDLPVLISYIDADQRYRFVNRAYERWFGQPRQEIIGKTLQEVLGPAAWQTVRVYVAQALAGRAVSYEAEVSYETAGTRWISATYIPHHLNDDPHEPVAGFTVLVSDISERRRLERERAALLDSERAARAEAETQRNNLHTLLMQVPAAIAIVTAPELRYVLSNAFNQRLAGGRQLVGRTVPEALPQLQAQGLVAVLKRVIETGEPFAAQEIPVTLDADEPMYLTGSYQPLRGPTGEVEGAMAFAFEVTDQVRSRRRAEEAEQRLRLAVEAAEVGTWDYYPDTRRLTCDARYKALFGLGPEAEVTARILADAIHPDDRPRVYAAAEQAFDPQGDGLYQISYRARGVEDGLERWIEMRGRTLFDASGKPTRFLGTGRDISEQRRAGERTRFLADASAILGSGLDARATLARVVELAVPQLADGCTLDLLDEDGQLELVAMAHADPERRQLGQELRRRYPPDAGGRSASMEVLRTGLPLHLPEVTEEVLGRVARDPEHLGLLRRMGFDSAILVPLLVRDRAIGVLALVTAGSGRRYGGEDLVLAEELARRMSMAAENTRLFQAAETAIQKRDDFVSIASHELRTPLASLSLYLESCLREVRRAGPTGAPDHTKLSSRLSRAAEQVDRLTRLVNDLLDVSRISAGRLALVPAEMDLAELTGEILERLKDQAAHASCTLEAELDHGVVGRWDRARLDEVITNLLTNAFKFGAGRPVRVEVTPRPPASGGGGRLVVMDRGPGIRPEDRQRVFERFERTAEAQNVGGIGLGLWIAHQIVLAHGGTIQVEGDPGQGARFVVELPSGPGS